MHSAFLGSLGTSQGGDAIFKACYQKSLAASVNPHFVHTRMSHKLPSLSIKVARHSYTHLHRVKLLPTMSAEEQALDRKLSPSQEKAERTWNTLSTLIDLAAKKHGEYMVKQLIATRQGYGMP